MHAVTSETAPIVSPVPVSCQFATWYGTYSDQVGRRELAMAKVAVSRVGNDDVQRIVAGLIQLIA